jgi:hypothetical protein
LERGEPDAINTVARSALIGPLEEWRRFELAVGLAAGEAIATACHVPLELRLLGGASSDPILSAGAFDLYWQQRTAHYSAPDLEASELITREILKAYGLSLGADRPDLVIVNRENSAVVAVVEVKYLAGDTASARFREAVEQVVRYARGYAPPGQTGPLIGRSLVALSHGAPKLVDASAGAPSSIDFAGIMRTELASWAQHVVAAGP